MFGLIGHLTSLAHAQEVARELGYEEYAQKDLDFWCVAPPQIVADITVKSITGKTIVGKYVESCFLPEMLLLKKFKAATRKVLNAMAHAQKHGINITALGGFSSIIFENFNLMEMLHFRNIKLEVERFTTGNTHTAYIICRQVEEGAQKYGIDLAKATVTVCGATGDIGSAVCRWLSVRSPIQELILVARNQERLQALRDSLGRGKIMTIEEALPQSDIVVWVASMAKGMEISPAILKKPSLLIDGGYPKNLATTIQVPDVQVINGGMVEHALDVDWQIMKWVNRYAPSRQLFACFAESMLLEFEGWYTNFSWGRNQITLEKMDQIGALSRKHGFRPIV